MRAATLAMIGAGLIVAVPAAPGAGAAPDTAALTASARAAAQELMGEMRLALEAALASGRVDQAIAACRERAPAIAQAQSLSLGGRVTRVSLKPRNSLLGAPDAWEQGVLREFDRRRAAGEDPASFEVATVVDEPDGQSFRYLKALPTQPLCLSCHGPRDSLAPDIRAALATMYPHDRAVGYAVGDVRGAVSVKIPLLTTAMAPTAPPVPGAAD